jgi:hypothetical protein
MSNGRGEIKIWIDKMHRRGTRQSPGFGGRFPQTKIPKPIYLTKRETWLGGAALALGVTQVAVLPLSLFFTLAVLV